MDFAAFLAQVVELLKKLFPQWFASKGIGDRIGLVLQILRAIGGLWPLPTGTDGAAWRVWVLKALGIAKGFATDAGLSILVDGLNVLEVLASSDLAWGIIWARIADSLVDNVVMQVSESDPDVIAAAEEAKIDPATIMLLIQLAVQVIQWWRNRKEG